MRHCIGEMDTSRMSLTLRGLQMNEWSGEWNMIPTDDGKRCRCFDERVYEPDRLLRMNNLRKVFRLARSLHIR